MWIFTEDGFLSAVRDTSQGKYKGQMVIRARSKDDLERFKAKYANGTMTPIHTTGPDEIRDYGYRAWMSAEDFGTALAAMGENVTYGNFKSQVAKTLGWDREKMLHKVWDVMAKLQPGGAYGVGGTKRNAGRWLDWPAMEQERLPGTDVPTADDWHGDDPAWATTAAPKKKAGNAKPKKRRHGRGKR